MKVVSWNCRCKYWDGIKHNEIVTKYSPDILGISECNSLEKLRLDTLTPYRCIKWVGQQGERNIKGVAAFVATPDICKPADDKYFIGNHPLKYSIPLRVNRGSLQVNLIFYRNCGLAKNKWGREWDFYKDFIEEHPTVIMGDFNCPANYPDALNLKRIMEDELKLISIYHARSKGEIFGREENHTFYPSNKKKPLFIDYCFISEKLRDRIKMFEIGERTTLSDHCPLILDIEE